MAHTYKGRFHKEPEFETLQLHAGQIPDPLHRARAPPIYASGGFIFKDSAHGASMFRLEQEGHMYTRLSNPTCEVLENRLAALEGGVSAVAVASGQSAQFMAILNIAKTGDNIVAPSFLYGGTYNQFKVTMPLMGINIKWVKGNDPQAYADAIDERTKAVYVETISNPKFTLVDIPEIAKVAHAHGIPLMVDNTFGMGGYLIKPFSMGADIIVASCTKWLGGHGTTIGGIVIDSGNFDWAASGKFPGFTTPAPAYNGIIYSEAFGNQAYCIKLRVELLRDLGPCMNPFGAFLLLQGLETLSLRAERHCENTLALAQWLKTHPFVAWVSYIGLPDHESHELAKKLLKPGEFGGVLTFGVKDSDMYRVARVVDNLKLAANLPNFGDAKTLVVHPARTTQSQLTPEEQTLSGAPPDLIRVSVGLEHIDDIIADFKAALDIVMNEDPSQPESN